ncbi:MAG: DUF924 family protein [Allosphingosinicella sp.]
MTSSGDDDTAGTASPPHMSDRLRRVSERALGETPGPTKPWAHDVLDFWFPLGWENWWKGSEALDTEIRERFQALWGAQREFPVDEFLTTPGDALAAVILFDQFPRNMFRGHADQFSTDHLALAIAKGAIERGYDDGMESGRRGFLYLPFEHSERIADQVQSLLLYTALGDLELLRFARLHHDVIERFSRFPHRNKVLGRKPTAMELAAGEVVPW